MTTTDIFNYLEKFFQQRLEGQTKEERGVDFAVQAICESMVEINSFGFNLTILEI